MMYVSRGLGTSQTNQLITSGISSGLTTAAIFDPEPISKAFLALAAGLTSIFGRVFSGCGQSCVQATHVVDQIEATVLKPTLKTYMESPVHTASLQKQALAIFDQAWAGVLQGCGDPALADAGRRCISERERGGSAPWCAAAGNPPGCGDWFTMYRDPIANDPNVVPDSNFVSSIFGTVGNSGGSIDPTAGSFSTPLLIGLALLAVAATQ